jgi:hypothetical protein
MPWPRGVRAASGRSPEELARELVGQLQQRAERAVDAAGLAWHAQAVDVLGRLGSGRIYRRRGVTHQASAPGEPPAPDTGALRASLGVERTGRLTRRFGSSSWIGLWLDRGTRRILPRPWMLRSVVEALDEMRRVMRRELQHG